jgi:hypothetical protein
MPPHACDGKCDWGRNCEYKKSKPPIEPPVDGQMQYFIAGFIAGFWITSFIFLISYFT